VWHANPGNKVAVLNAMPHGVASGSSVALTLPEQLRQPRDVDSDAPRLVLRQQKVA
jgi:hypothetical protein